MEGKSPITSEKPGCGCVDFLESFTFLYLEDLLYAIQCVDGESYRLY